MEKGFTLIELLAVIVILAIIALIATPIVLSIIEEVEESSLLRSAEFYLDAVEQSIIKKNLNTGGSFAPNECVVQTDGNLLCDNKDTLEVEVSGEKPSSGIITFDEKGIQNAQNIVFGNKYVNINSEGNKTVSDNVLITNFDISYKDCFVNNEQGCNVGHLTKTCIPEIKIEPENAVNKILEFKLDEYYYDIHSDSKALFNQEITLNSRTGELTKLEPWDSYGYKYTYITVRSLDGSNITKKIKVYGCTVWEEVN